MKPSMYNLIYARNDCEKGYIAYNSFSGALALMSEEEFHEYTDFSNGENGKLSNSLLEELKKGGFIVDDDTDEVMLVRHQARRARYASDMLGLTIAPTSDCNFRCAYCFEKGVLHNTVMSEETQNALISFIERQMPRISHLGISWYGGEPMMQMDIIERLSKRFMEMAEKHSVTYSAAIVTNGSLLTESNAKRLCECGVSVCQVTIDGGADSHNRRRPFANGAGTYEVITKNLSKAASVLPNIMVRVNLDKSNMNDFFEIKQFFNKNGLENVRVYPAMVSSHNDCYDSKVCFDTEEFLALEYQIIRDAGTQKSKIPVFRGNVCCADAVGGYVVDADGSLYKCWSDIGQKELSFGNILTGIDRPMNEIIYLNEEIDAQDECKQCKLLPVCLGGCPYRRRTGYGARCISSEDILGKYLNDIADAM